MDGNTEAAAQLVSEIWQNTPKGANQATNASEKILQLVLLSVAVALGNALVVLLKEGLLGRKLQITDGRRKSLAQVA